MLAVTNNSLKNWDLKDVEFIGTNEKWEKAFEIYNEEFPGHVNNI